MPKDNVKRRSAALKRLGVSEEDLRGLPDVSGLLKQAHRGLTGTLEAMRFSGHADIIRFLDAYDLIPARDRDSLPWEAILIKAEVDLNAFLGAAIIAIQNYSRAAVKIIALSHHPEITRARVDFAKLAGGDKDRAALDTGLGFLPQPKGNTFIINPAGAKELPEGDEDDDGPMEDDVDKVFPSLSETQSALVPARARMLVADTGKASSDR